MTGEEGRLTMRPRAVKVTPTGAKLKHQGKRAKEELSFLDRFSPPMV
ncbi:MAG: hypothetical protein ABI977_11440 [Acidobacteriota bacterium]